MSNPVGFSTLVDPPEGLGFCGEHLTGGAPNFVGSASDPAISDQVVGLYFYVPPTEGEPIEMLDGSPVVPCSDVFLQCRGVLTHTIYDYGAVPMNGSFSASITTSTAVEVAAGATCEFVTVQTTLDFHLSAGYVHCSETLDVPSISTAHLTMSGVEYDTLPTSGGIATTWPRANYTPVTWGIDVGTVFWLRPTAHTWPGQDPDNQWNRAIWQPSEIGVIEFAFSGSGFEYNADVSTAMYGYQPHTDYPTPCPVTPGISGTPSIIIPGLQQAGITPPPPIRGA